LPVKYDAQTQQPNVNYATEMREMEESVQRSGGVIVILNFSYRAYLPSEKELLAALPLQAVATLSDGTIYEIKK
jgi:hypothetical protein